MARFGFTNGRYLIQLQTSGEVTPAAPARRLKPKGRDKSDRVHKIRAFLRPYISLGADDYPDLLAYTRNSSKHARARLLFPHRQIDQVLHVVALEMESSRLKLFLLEGQGAGYNENVVNGDDPAWMAAVKQTFISIADDVLPNPFNERTKEIRDFRGYTPFGAAVYRQAMAANGALWFVSQLRLRGCDVDAPQRHGWSAYDIAVLGRNRAMEDWLAGIPNIRSSFRRPHTEDFRANPVDILMSYSAIDPDMTRDVRQAFETLAEEPLFLPVLQLAARNALRARDPEAKRGLRLFFTGDPNCMVAGFSAGAGAYEPSSHTLIVAGKRHADFFGMRVEGRAAQDWEKDLLVEEPSDWRKLCQTSLEGTLIHELTHFAAAVIYQNKDALPYADGDDAGRTAYYQAFFDDLELPVNQRMVARFCNPITNGATANPDQINPDTNGREYLYAILFGHTLDYLNKFAPRYPNPEYTHNSPITGNNDLDCRVLFGYEIITHTIQAIHMYPSRSRLNRHMPNCIRYLVDVFLPAVQDAVDA